MVDLEDDLESSILEELKIDFGGFVFQKIVLLKGKRVILSFAQCCFMYFGGTKRVRFCPTLFHHVLVLWHTKRRTKFFCPVRSHVIYVKRNLKKLNVKSTNVRTKNELFTLVSLVLW